MLSEVELPVCPYCGKNLNFREAWLIHRDGEYKCIHCREVSEITYNKSIKRYRWILIAVSLLIVAVSIFLGEVNVFEMILTAVPFIFFYILVPYTMELKVKKRRENNKRNIFLEDDFDIKVYDIKEKYTNIYDDPLDYDDIERTKVF